MLVLGIETSCDETALSLVEDGQKILAVQVASSLKQHQRYGGVVPEIASRAHVELFTYECEALLLAAGVDPSAIDRIAVTQGPGLPGSLMVGVAAAKALALAWGKPIVGVNHLQAHLYAALMAPPPDDPPKADASGVPAMRVCRVPSGLESGGGVEEPSGSLEVPMIGLVISGGHTALVRMRGLREIRLMGQTRDDAVGEAFDKVAKLLGLSFPGGPEIEREARGGNPKAFRFTAPKIKSGSPYDFSFSGIKTAVLHKVRAHDLELRNGAASSSRSHELSPEFTADLSASFQASVVEELVMKSVAACRVHRVGRLIVGGGVIANGFLRERLRSVCADLRIQVAIPSLGLCTDNGAMVAGLGYHLNPTDPRGLRVIPDLRVELN